MSKQILIIDDKSIRLNERQRDIERAGYTYLVDFKTSLDFVEFDDNVNPIIHQDFLASGVKCVFVHASNKVDSRFPESSIRKIRLAIRPILLISFSGGGNTELTVPKLKYEDFESNLLTFLNIFSDYEELFIDAFSGKDKNELAVYFREEINRLIQSSDNIPLSKIVKSNYFTGLLKYAGTTFEVFAKKYNIESLKPIELARICLQLSK